MHWPKISEKKKLELETLKMSLKTSPKHKKSPHSVIGQNNKDDISNNHHPRATSEHNEDS